MEKYIISILELLNDTRLKYNIVENDYIIVYSSVGVFKIETNKFLKYHTIIISLMSNLQLPNTIENQRKINTLLRHNTDFTYRILEHDNGKIAPFIEVIISSDKANPYETASPANNGEFNLLQQHVMNYIYKEFKFIEHINFYLRSREH